MQTKGKSFHFHQAWIFILDQFPYHGDFLLYSLVRVGVDGKETSEIGKVKGEIRRVEHLSVRLGSVAFLWDPLVWEELHSEGEGELVIEERGFPVWDEKEELNGKRGERVRMQKLGILGKNEVWYQV